MAGGGWCPRGRGKAASQDPCGSGRAELGSFPTPQLNTSGKEMRCLVQEEVSAAVEETRSCKAVGMKHQGAWTRWEKVVERKVTWTEIWKAEPHRIKFLI